ncbi:hypothetical protein ACSX1A_16405 [Pontibacter sp. MBLB2868]|uniref:hypothetical protein n=1 Tax=Pontibacter sp. MBLB2868 TaxID=3451555 RepID=UPI003F756A3C
MTLNFYIGGYGRDSYRLTLHDNELRCSEYYGILLEHDKIVPIEGNKNWDQLMSFLKSCDWKRRYDSDILDGTQWELKLKAPGVNINSYGSNAYPDNFDELMILLNRLLSETGIQLEE